MAKHEVRRVEIEPDSHGGHTVTAHLKERPMHSGKSGMGMEYREPEKKVFGKGQHKEMIDHVASHLGVEAGMGEENEEHGKEQDSE